MLKERDGERSKQEQESEESRKRFMQLDYASLTKLMGETMSLRYSIFVSHDRLINHSNES